jgi:hypothetical protein
MPMSFCMHYSTIASKQGLKSLVDTFYTELSQRAESAAILARLAPEDFSHLKAGQAEHLRFMLAGGTTPEEHYKRAVQVGWVHASVGVSLPMMMEAYHLYHRLIKQHRGLRAADIQQRARLDGALDQRISVCRILALAKGAIISDSRRSGSR